MATIINADTATGGAIITGDGSGILEIQSAGTTKLTINGSGVSITGAGQAVGTTSSQTLTNKTVTNIIFDGSTTEDIFTLGTTGSLTLSPSNGTIQTCALTGNPTFTDSLLSGQSIILMLTNGSSYSVAYPTVTWVTGSGNIAPALTAADTLVFWKIGTTLYGAYVGSYA